MNRTLCYSAGAFAGFLLFAMICAAEAASLLDYDGASGLQWGKFALFLPIIAFFALSIEKKRERPTAPVPATAAPNAELQQAVAKLQTENRELKDAREYLTALRNITNLLTNESDFGVIMREVLNATCGLVEAEEVLLCLLDKKSGKLNPAAMIRNGQYLSAPELDAKDQEMELLERSFLDMRSYSRSMTGYIEMAYPVVADREAVGALRVLTPLSGEAEQRSNHIEKVESLLYDLLRHLGMAIKTPTLYDMAVIDGLTRLYVKRHALAQLDIQLAEAKRHRLSLSLLMTDIDKFKLVNDTYGHLTGDLVLSGVARIIKDCVRTSDIAFRYGGEEMGVILGRAGADEALILAERIRKKVEETPFVGERGETIRVTLSIGVSEYAPPCNEKSADLIRGADQALYWCKENGRNRCRVRRKPEGLK